MRIAGVWHPGMPQPQIANHHVSLAARWLDRGSYLSPLLAHIIYDRRDDVADLSRRIWPNVFLGDSGLLVAKGCVRMGSEPELG
jgi:hypothetical protein